MSSLTLKDGVSRLTLPREIHDATQMQHTALNRLITSRLPRCLPPNADSPYLYALGISAFGEIYMAFEESLKNYSQNEQAGGQFQLQLQQFPNSSLARTQSLDNDLRVLRSRCKDLPEVQVNFGPLIQRIKSSISSEPHRILAYQWVMYMALFNGGRWIRSQLVAHGPSFWKGSRRGGSDTDEEIDCLSFWDFPSHHDGEGIKDDFKARFIDLGMELNDKQRREVVDEAVRIFELCAAIVELLDSTTTSRCTSQPYWPTFIYIGIVIALTGLWLHISTSFTLWRRSGYPLLSKQPIFFKPQSQTGLMGWKRFLAFRADDHGDI